MHRLWLLLAEGEFHRSRGGASQYLFLLAAVGGVILAIVGIYFWNTVRKQRVIRDEPDATPEELSTAAARAQALDFIALRRDGFEAAAGERGRSLSGGERQRLSIARALLKDPPILILDEATSALDAATEHKLKAALEEVIKGRTTFVIAHRLATVRHATRILVFEAGRIVESGTFDELVGRGGRFAELARAQFLMGGLPAGAPSETGRGVRSPADEAAA